MNDFVAEIRPLSYNRVSQQALEPKCDQTDLKLYNNLDLRSNHGYSVEDPSDLHLQKILTDRKFSRESMTTLLEGSILTLVEKLLTGRSISKIEGTLCVSMFNDESPIILNLHKAFLKPYGNSFLRDHDLGSSLNIKIKDPRDISIINQSYEKTVDSCSPCFEIPSEAGSSPNSSLGYHSDKDSCNSSPVHDSYSSSPTPCLDEDGDVHTDGMEINQENKSHPNKANDYLSSENDQSDTTVAASKEETNIELMPEQECPAKFNGNFLVMDAVSSVRNAAEYQPEPFSCWSPEEGDDNNDEISDDEMEFEHRLVIDDNATTKSDEIWNLESTADEVTPADKSDGRKLPKVNKQCSAVCKDENKENQTDDFEDVETSIASDLAVTDYKADLPGNSKNAIGNASSVLHPQSIVCKVAEGFKCKRCSTVLPDTMAVSRHVERSYGLYCCTYCCRSFTAVNNLKRHVRRHSGLKPYKCSKCPQSFFRGDELKGHMTRHGYKKQLWRFPRKKCFTDNHWIKNQMTTSQKSYLTQESALKFRNVQLTSESLFKDHARKQQDQTNDKPKTEGSLLEPMKTGKRQLVFWQEVDCHRNDLLSEGLKSQSSEEFARRWSSDSLTQRSGSSGLEDDENDDGQLLDLSMKKPLSSCCRVDDCNDGQSNRSCCTSLRTGGQSVYDVSRNGDVFFEPVDLSRGREADERVLSVEGGHQDVNSYLPSFSRNGLARGMCERSLATIHEAQNAGFSKLEPAHRPKRVERSSSSTLHHAPSMRRTVSALNNPIGRSPLRFNPYNVEKMADLATKFMIARGKTLAGKSGPLQAIIPVGEENKAIIIREQDKGRKKELSLAIVPKVQSLCEERGTLEQENRRQDVSGRQNLEGTGEFALDYSNPETALGCHIPTVVKSEPLSEQDESGDSLTEFHVRKTQTDDVTVRAENGNSYCCEICRELFESFIELESHSVDIHKRYLCEHCKKSFTARPNRDRHVRYHTGERPYKCDLCVQAFFRGDDLKYHRTTRHPSAQPYVCTHCSASFTWGRDLERHIRHSKCKV